MSHRSWKAYLLLVVSLTFALSPLVTSGFNGFEPDQFPIAQTNPPAQPAGYAFAIWGVIYLGLIASAGFGLLKRRHDPWWEQTRTPLIVSLAVGSFWIPAAQQAPLLATVMIWIMALGAIVALLRAPDESPWALDVPLGLYAGWLTAAANLSVALVLVGYGIVGPQWAALISLSATALMTFYVLRRKPMSRGYGAAVVWALIGICVANTGASLQSSNVWVLALCTLVIGAIAARLSSASKPPAHGAAWAQRRD